MFAKQLQYGLIGAIIGFILGLIAGAGFINYNTTKGQREDYSNGMIFVVGGIGAVIGILAGTKIAEDSYKEEQLGLNKLNEGMFKAGRFWTAMTAWKDPKTGRETRIITGKDQSGNLVTTLGSKTIINHPTTSGSQVNVSKYHNEAKGQVFRHLKGNFNSGRNIEELF